MRGDLTTVMSALCDAIGQPITVGLPKIEGLPAETLTTGFRTSGLAQTFTISEPDPDAAVTTPVSLTPLVTGVSYSGTGQMLSRSYGNDVTRSYTWDPVTRALTGLSASFPIVESGSPQTVFVQKDAFVRDVMGRIVQSTAEVPVADGAVGAGQVTAECFSYDGFNRLASAWTVADASVPTCGGAAPADDTVTGWDASDTAYAAAWAYSPGGRITSLVKGAGIAAATSTYAYADAAHPAAATSVSTGSDVNSFTYDDAGRTVSRTVDGVTTNLTWDVTSSLTESDGQGGRVVYAYDASGQRVLQARVADAEGVGTASAYVASGQVDDPNTAATSTGDLTATRYYTFAGSTVAVRTNDGKLSLMLGDEQGSTNVVMPVTTTTGGAMVAATLSDASLITRTSYTPYGELRGADNTAVDRGWLGQVEDRIEGTGASSTGTGLTYLNARYYDPVLSRFLSPDPLMNPGDPRTLDPYRYADNNPVVFTDASGLKPLGQFDYADVPRAKPQVKPFTAKFAKGVVKAVWKTAATDAVNMIGPVMFFKSTKLLVTNPKGFAGQYGQAWNTATDVGSAWWSQAKAGVSVLKGDKSVGDYFSQMTHSSLMAHWGNSWDAKDADAVGSTYAHFLEIASGATGLKAGIKPRNVAAAEAGPLESGNLYINGSQTPNNLTPRFADTDGLSSFNTIERAISPGKKGQCISAACLADGGLGAFKTGPEGHYSIQPLAPGGLAEWLGARAAGTEAESPFTQFLIDNADEVWNR